MNGDVAAGAYAFVLHIDAVAIRAGWRRDAVRVGMDLDVPAARMDRIDTGFEAPGGGHPGHRDRARLRIDIDISSTEMPRPDAGFLHRRFDGDARDGDVDVIGGKHILALDSIPGPGRVAAHGGRPRVSRPEGEHGGQGQDANRRPRAHAPATPESESHRIHESRTSLCLMGHHDAPRLSPEASLPLRWK